MMDAIKLFLFFVDVFFVIYLIGCLEGVAGRDNQALAKNFIC